MSAKDVVKILCYKRGITITKLAEKLSELTGHNYTRQGLSNKLSRNTLKYSEIEYISKILNYKIEFVDI